MISGAILYDLAGAKEWASTHFSVKQIPDEILQEVITHFFDLILEDDMESCVSLRVSDISFCLVRANEKTLLITYSNDEKMTEDEVKRTSYLKEQISDLLMAESIRSVSKRWDSIVDRVLRKNICLYFVLPFSLLDESLPGKGIQGIVDYSSASSKYEDNFYVGPFEIHSSLHNLKGLGDEDDLEALSESDAIVTIISSRLDPQRVVEYLKTLLEHKSIPMLVVPATDEDLEIARDLESHGFRLCDSITDDPVDLTLGILAMMGESYMQPDLARKKWVIEEPEPPIKESDVSEEKEQFGHKAFFVVNRIDGEAIFSFYYDVSSEFLERSPNVIAAITMFEFDSGEDSRTSVFRTGELVYAVIEHEDLIFALITGQQEGIEDLRRRFSFLPDLWQEEDPENLRCDSEPYSSPPFALKLLATLPPEKLPMRYYPIRKKAPDWEQFRYPEVRDLLKAVWEAIERPVIVERFASEEGPNMTLGAIHLLRILDAIEFDIMISLEDKPKFVGEPDVETKRTYSHIDEIRKHTDGDLTINQIGKTIGISPTVLLRVFQDLHRRGLVELRNADM